MERVRRIAASAGPALARAPRRLGQLEGHELLLLLQAPFALVLADLGLRRWGFAGLHARLTGGAPRRRPPAAAEDRRAKARRVAWCVQVSAAYLPWVANCLRRSVVACWFLHRSGLEGDLRIGVRREPDGGLDFHAWVEYEGEVLNDRRDVTERYATFDGPVLPRGASFG
jgi:hypothetical protein